MTKKELMIKAHQMTRAIKIEYPGVDYRFQLGLCLAYLQKGENTMVELTGSEKQIKWAKEIREEMLLSLDYYYNKRLLRVANAMEINSNLEKQDRKDKAKLNLDIVKNCIENQISAKKFIDTKTSSMRLGESIVDMDFILQVFNNKRW